MSSRCLSSPTALGCVDSRAPVRATYVNLYKWPESDAEFVKSVSSGEQRRRPHRYQHQHHPRVVDSYSCRQMYLRSYTFSKKQTVPERTRKCLARLREKVSTAVNGKAVPCVSSAASRGCVDGSVGMVHLRNKNKKKKRCLVMMRRLREVSSAALHSVLHRLLSCTAAVDVADRQPS